MTLDRGRSVVGRGLALVVLTFALMAGVSVAGTEEYQRQEALRHYRAGLDAMQAESWDVAEAEFKAAIKLDPLLTLAHYGLGQTHMATRAYTSAVTAFTACNAAYMQVAALQITDSALADQRRQEEIRELREAITAFLSGPLKSYYMDSQILRLESRLQELERQRSRGSTNPEIPAEFSLALGSAYFRSGFLPDAEREYQAAIKVNSKMGEAHNNLAVVYMMTGRADEAEKAIRQAEKTGFRVNPQLKKDVASKH